MSLAPAVAHARHMHGHVCAALTERRKRLQSFEGPMNLRWYIFGPGTSRRNMTGSITTNLDLPGVSYQYAGQMRLADNVLRRSFELTSIEFSQELNERCVAHVAAS